MYPSTFAHLNRQSHLATAQSLSARKANRPVLSLRRPLGRIAARVTVPHFSRGRESGRKPARAC